MNDLKHLTVNIGPELLRTYLAIVDSRSFTKTAQSLGISQPTVSGHVKRLQEQLDAELLDRSAPGVRLTAQGEIVASYARQILAAHDELFARIGRGRAGVTQLRIGIPYEMRCAAVVPAIAKFFAEHPQTQFELYRDVSDNLLRLVNLGQLDLSLSLTHFEPRAQASSYWSETLHWVALPALHRAIQEPVPIVAHPFGSSSRDIVTAALEEAGLGFRIVLSTENIAGVIAAAGAGLGYCVLPRSQVTKPLVEIPDGILPKLRDCYWGLYLSEGAQAGAAEILAALIADTLKGHRFVGGELALTL